ncbi:MAG: hypothetical protein ACR2QU_09620, partial [Gammaproteobacteria bacterium]
MQFDNDINTLGAEQDADGGDDTQEKMLEWLLDQDLSEPEEKLFTVDDDMPELAALTEAEAAVASRPMIGGSATSDDLSSMVSEEIVMTSTGQADIFSAPGNSDDGESGQSDGSGVMAIEYSRQPSGGDPAPNAILDEGSDILGLVDDDTIGEQFLSLKTVEPVRKVEEKTETELTDPQVAASMNDETPEICVDTKVETPAESTAPSAELDTLTLVTSELEETDGAVEPEQVVEEVAAITEEEKVTSQDVRSYVLSTQLPTEDDAFDQYLLEGENLEQNAAALDELQVARAEGVISVDPELDYAIDYHEDFRGLDDFEGRAITAITEVIGEVMNDLTDAVKLRLVELELDNDCIDVDVMLGTDADSVRHCVDQGYAPVSAVAEPMPARLSGLAQTELDAIYVRLSHGELEGDWNNLLQADFEAPEGVESCDSDSRQGVSYEMPVEAASQVDIESVLGDIDLDFDADNIEVKYDETSEHTAGAGEPAPALDSLLENVDIEEPAEESASAEPGAPDPFTEELGESNLELVQVETNPEFDAPSNALPDVDTNATEAAEVSHDEEVIESLLGDIDLEFDAPSNALADGDTDALEAAEVSHDEEMIEAVLGEIDLEFDAPSSALPDVDTDAEAMVEDGLDEEVIDSLLSDVEMASADVDMKEGETPPVEQPEAVFDDDIFTDELTDELIAGEADEVVDVEAMIDSLGAAEKDINDICGIEVGEFANEKEVADLGVETSANDDIGEIDSSAPDTGVEAGSWCIPSEIQFSTASTRNVEIFVDFLDAFIEEAASELEKLEDAIA